MRRRHFLQFAASTLATLGMSHVDIRREGIRYGRVLAQSTPRKLALLVGINQYQPNLRFTNLKGCATDVEMQRRLLIHRFGFNPGDILILTDEAPQKPTRQNILNAFQEHLIKQAKPGDVVVFHFSGHGSRVADPTPIRTATGVDRLNSTFVPMDATPRTDNGVDDIMGRTLFLLMNAVDTENLTVVLDSCHAGGGTRGNIRVRSAQGGADFKPSQKELDYQAQWLSQSGIAPDAFAQMRDLGVAKGVVIASAQRDQEAADVTFNQFDAGAFTYFLTQYLWQETGTVEGAIANVSRGFQSNRIVAQLPLYDVKPNSRFEQQPPYFLQAQTTSEKPFAEGAVVSVRAGRGTVWLGGVDAESIAAFDTGATLVPVEGSGEVKILSRQGLTAEVSFTGQLSEGVSLREAARVIPSNLKLRIGLDPSLESDTESFLRALNQLNRIEAVRSQSSNSPYPSEVHYILSCMTPAYRSFLLRRGANFLPPVGNLGLLSQGLDEIIPGSFLDNNVSDESIEMAIARLQPKLTALVAARLVRLTLNATSSQVNLKTTMQIQGRADALVGEAFTVRGGNQPEPTPNRNGIQKLPRGSLFQFELTNNELQDLYICILFVSSGGEMAVLFPNPYIQDSFVVPAGRSRLVPDPNQGDNFEFYTDESGTGEALIIASRSPLRQAVQRLSTLADEQNALAKRSFVIPTDDAIASLLGDLSSTRGGTSSQATNAEIRTSEVAALSISFEVA